MIDVQMVTQFRTDGFELVVHSYDNRYPKPPNQFSLFYRATTTFGYNRIFKPISKRQRFSSIWQVFTPSESPSFLQIVLTCVEAVEGD